MKTILISILFCFPLYMLSAQESICFENQFLGMAFIGNSNWSYVDSSQGTFELQNGNHNLSLKMWKEIERGAAEIYLPELVLAQGMATVNGPFKTEIDNKEACAVIAICNEKRQPVKMLFVAFEVEDGINIIRFKCPNECFQNHKKQMNELIKAIKIIDKPESHLFLAKYSIDA